MLLPSESLGFLTAVTRTVQPMEHTCKCVRYKNHGSVHSPFCYCQSKDLLHRAWRVVLPCRKGRGVPSSRGLHISYQPCRRLHSAPRTHADSGTPANQAHQVASSQVQRPPLWNSQYSCTGTHSDFDLRGLELAKNMQSVPVPYGLFPSPKKGRGHMAPAGGGLRKSLQQAAHIRMATASSRQPQNGCACWIQGFTSKAETQQ